MSAIQPPVVHHQAQPGSRPRALHYPKVAATIAFVLGMFITALGAGIGIRHLTKAGWTWTGVLGLLLLVGGLILLACAGIVVWRGTRRWERPWFIPIAVVALLVMSSVAQGAMLAYAPRSELGSEDPADRALPYADVSFRTSDGVLLSAWFIPSTNLAAVVTMPGSGSNRSATLDQAGVLAGHGFGVLMVDPRGQGRSWGNAMDAG